MTGFLPTNAQGVMMQQMAGGQVRHSTSGRSNNPAIAGANRNKNQVQLSPREEKTLRKAAANFEAMFIKQLLGSMRKTVPDFGDGGLMRKSNGEKIFRDMLDQEYADVASKGNGGLGLKEAIYEQLTRRPGGRPGGAINPSLEALKAQQAAMQAQENRQR
ncbi:rod-binding protein [Magnetococcus sp. PR-3]|uniref:rod-binding protein n=1 Tax=Magnetococcus sp. PR-3 TaxID=3120355 RepID=UPI002FCE3473